MGSDTAIIETLRAARGEVDIVQKLKEGSLEARRGRLAEALADPSWDGGPAELIATYPHHVAARKDGVIMRIPVIEDADSVRLGKPEIFSIPTPVSDVSQELMATAQTAAEFVMREDYTSAGPMIRSIAGALDVKGDLHRRLSMDVAIRGLARRTWWQDIVEEQIPDAVPLPAPKPSALESIDDLLAVLKENAAAAVTSLQSLSAQETHRGAVECARDIAEDIKTAVSVLTGVNRDDADEMTRVYEEVGRVVPRLLKGISFLKNLSHGK